MLIWYSTVDTSKATPCYEPCCLGQTRYRCPNHPGKHVTECPCVPLHQAGYIYQELDGATRARVAPRGIRRPVERYAPGPQAKAEDKILPTPELKEEAAPKPKTRRRKKKAGN